MLVQVGTLGVTICHGGNTGYLVWEDLLLYLLEVLSARVSYSLLLSLLKRHEVGGSCVRCHGGVLVVRLSLLLVLQEGGAA